MKKSLILASSLMVIATSACAHQTEKASSSSDSATVTPPSDIFDLSHWKITVPIDLDNNKKVDSISVAKLEGYSHPDFFYLDEQNKLVFTAPNKAITTPNSSNTRSELRYMSRGKNTKIKTHAPGNNFALASHSNAAEFGSIGGKLEATLSVNHVAKNAGYADKYPAYSAVVGQIHAVKHKEKVDGFGWGNEPIKIYYKKWPDHKYGSVFWTYERNLAKEDPSRTDIVYPVWGNTWDNPEAPGSEGVLLNEEFSYTINVHQDIMYLTFESDKKDTVEFKINLADNVDANGKVDEKDHPKGYAGDSLYFKAGIYDQCSTRDAPGFWYAACPGTGDWETDKKNGDYAQATFSKIVVSESTAP